MAGIPGPMPDDPDERSAIDWAAARRTSLSNG
jgi:hypothetical protein